jgi:alpha-methylacyl-CoA racemase
VSERGGPLAGVRVVELLGLGPGPFCGMLLADLGAEVVRVDRVEASRALDTSRPATNALYRSKDALGIDLKQPAGVELFLQLTDRADALVDVFRPGVAERLGIGPDIACARNPRLVYGRLTGYGQDGPLAHKAGHDIDYLAIAGALEPPTPPINVLADFAGGGMLLAYGIVAALLARERTGAGQVVDAAMIDGAAIMLTPFYAARASGFWGPRGTNMLDTGSPWYDSYETSDGAWLALGAIEPQFYAQLVEALGLDAADLPDQHDRDQWPELRRRFAAVIRTRTRDAWEQHFESFDACVAPVLAPEEAPSHPHNQARRTFRELRGVPQPAPAPRFSATPLGDPVPPAHPGERTHAVLRAWGIAPEEIDDLVDSGVVV